MKQVKEKMKGLVRPQEHASKCNVIVDHANANNRFAFGHLVFGKADDAKKD